jgi:hypothetical protein
MYTQKACFDEQAFLLCAVGNQGFRKRRLPDWITNGHIRQRSSGSMIYA